MSSATPVAGTRDRPIVLFVEDDPAVVARLRAAFPDPDLSLLFAATGGDALAAVETGNVDLVYWNLGLALGPGLDALDALRARRPDLPIVMTTPA